MSGGMSHLDTFDPKPGADVMGPTQVVDTDVDGVRIAANFPNMRKRMRQVALVRSMWSNQGAHAQGRYFLHTSYQLRGTIRNPSTGGWLSAVRGKGNPALPSHVAVGGDVYSASGGFLASAHYPLPIGEPSAGLQNAHLPATVSDEVFHRRLARVEEMDRAFEERYGGAKLVRAYAEAYEQAVKLMGSKDLEAFDIAKEPDAVRDSYGRDRFGQGVLLARRLLEYDVRFVEVVSDGWDTHNENFDAMDEKCPDLDRTLAALLEDLDARGMLDDTLVVLATEFGRTPQITGQSGRNHHPQAFTCLLAGRRRARRHGRRRDRRPRPGGRRGQGDRAGLQRHDRQGARAAARARVPLALGPAVPDRGRGAARRGGVRVRRAAAALLALPLALPLAAQDTPRFEADVLPILERCFRCHAAPSPKLKAPKGGLRLDGAEWIRRGGEGGTVLTPGKPGESPLYLRTVLPPDDPDVMPAKGDPLSAAEAAVLRAWIAAGADFGGWTGAEAGALPPAAVREDRDPARVARLRELAQGLEPLSGELLAKVAGSTAQITPVLEDATLVRVQFRSAEDRVDDQALAALAPIRERIAELDLSRTKVTDKALAELARMPRLVRLDLSRTAVSDRGLGALRGLANLAWLNLHGTQVGDAGLDAVAGMKHLAAVYLWDSRVTATGAAALREQLPNAKVHFERALPAPAPPQDGDRPRRRR
jgi:hypothetical protein